MAENNTLGVPSSALSPAATQLIEKLLAGNNAGNAALEAELKKRDEAHLDFIQKAHDKMHEAGAGEQADDEGEESEQEEEDEEQKQKYIALVNQGLNTDTLVKAEITALIGRGRYSPEDRKVLKALHDMFCAAGAKCRAVEMRKSMGMSGSSMALVKALKQTVKAQQEMIEKMLNRPQQIQVVPNPAVTTPPTTTDAKQNPGSLGPHQVLNKIEVKGADDIIDTVQKRHERGGKVINNITDLLN